jgi:hypothetical protein
MQTVVNAPPYQLGYGANFPKIVPGMLEKEPSLQQCSEQGVSLSGGGLANVAMKHVQASFANEIRRAKEEGLSAMVDVHVQYLLPGMYPAAPGWHCDCVPCGMFNGQPSFDAIHPRAFSVAVSLSSEPKGVSNTEFVTDAVKVKLFSADEVYRDLNDQIKRIAPMVAQISDGVFVRYTPKSIHRAVETHRRGWRMLFRYSMCEKPPITNTVPKQQQVYLLAK